MLVNLTKINGYSLPGCKKDYQMDAERITLVTPPLPSIQCDSFTDLTTP